MGRDTRNGIEGCTRNRKGIQGIEWGHEEWKGDTRNGRGYME